MPIAAIAALVAACGHPAGPAAALPGAEVDTPADGSDDGGPAPGDEAPSRIGPFVLDNARLPGGAAVAIEIRGGVIAAVHDVAPAELARVDLAGKTVIPGFIDSHVHLAYQYGEAGIEEGRRTLAAAGIVAGVDLAAPAKTLPAFADPGWIAAGPMITSVRGYPTQSWGSDGYGLQIAGADEAAAAVDSLVEQGAAVIKVPVEGDALSDDELAAIVERAHAKALLVVAHALGDADAARAAAHGADVLAHTPLEPLSEATVDAWAGRAVISTLDAFGGRPAAVDNLRRLHAAGATVVYGTDLGNSRAEWIDGDELALLAEAGLQPAEIVAAGTVLPAALWGMETLGALEPGRAASLLVLDGDPLADPSVIAEPFAVYLDGRLLESRRAPISDDKKP